jgi:hypothetical protein
VLASTAVLSLSLLLGADRPDTPGSDELFRFEAGDTVEVFDTERFRVHYTRAGVHSVPLADDEAEGVVGVPDHVEQIGAIYEEVATFYEETLGWRTPLGDFGADADNDDARFDVYLIDFNFSADGAFRAESCVAGGDQCAGFMVQENDFAGYGYPSVTYANRLLASHELFHAVQAAYDTGQGSVLGEGTAVWASEQFDPSLDDLEGFGFAYLDQTSRPLNADGVGPVDAFTYGTGLWFEHIAQLHGDDIVRAIYEAVEDEGGASSGADWFALLDDVLASAAQAPSSFDEDFVSFAASTIDVVAPNPIVTLPFSTGSFLTFIASWHTLSFNPSGRANVRVAIVGEGVDVDGIRLVVAPDGETPEEIAPTSTTPPAGEVPVAFDVTRPSTDRFFRVQLINTRRDGDASRPRLCIGDDEEVNACIDEELTQPGEGEGEGEAGEGEGEPPPSCACAATSDAPFAIALALTALVRSRRRRAM